MFVRWYIHVLMYATLRGGAPVLTVVPVLASEWAVRGVPNVVIHGQLFLLHDRDACCKTRTLNVSAVPLHSLQTTVSVSRADGGVVLAEHHLAYALAIC